MSTSAIAVSDPSNPALGTTSRTHPLNRAQASLKIPDARSIAIPRNHACCAAASGESPPPVRGLECRAR